MFDVFGEFGKVFEKFEKLKTGFRDFGSDRYRIFFCRKPLEPSWA